MRAFDRDLIRGGHYGQRSWVPHSKAEHMAAPTKGCDVKILLANPEPVIDLLSWATGNFLDFRPHRWDQVRS
jgi:hypothetical protein